LRTTIGGMKTTILAVALGFFVMAGSLVSGALIDGGQVNAAPSACSCETKVTTTALNLRSGPGTNYNVQLVMPQGAKVQASTNSDLHKNGFVKVGYNDNYGWASEDYLADGGADTGGNTHTGGGTEDIVGVAVTTSDVNFRQGPGFDNGIQFVIENGAQVAITNIVENGFRYVWHAGSDGWIYDVYLTRDNDGGYATSGTAKTTDYVNFRSGPSLDQSVIKVLQPGTKVEVTKIFENGFRQVSINGTKGWIHDDYLA
jgi:uncharacterized protein YraI